MVEVRRYLNRASADVARALLESCGIAARVAADNEGGMAPHLSYLSGVRLMVHESDLGTAKDVLADSERRAAGPRLVDDAEAAADAAESRERRRRTGGKLLKVAVAGTIALILILGAIAAFAAIGTAAPGAAVVGTAEPQGMNLKDCVLYALLHAPRQSKARESLTVAELQARQAHAKYYPSLDLTANQGAQKTLPQSEPPPKSPLFGNLGLALTETFWDFGQTSTLTHQAETTAEVARLAALKTRDDVILDVVHAYYSLTQADLQLQIKKQQRELLGKQFRQLAGMFRQGMKTKKDYLRFQSQVEKASLDVMGGETTRRTAEINLKRLLGVPETDRTLAFATVQPEEALRAEPTFPAKTPSAEAMYAIKINKLSDDAAKDAVDLARLKHGPQLAVTSEVDYNNPDYVGVQAKPWVSDSVSWNVTFGVKYNLYDNGSRERDVLIAEGQRLAQSEDYRDALLQVTADIGTLMGTLANLRTSFDLNRRLMALEEENFTNLEMDYRQGKVAYLDLVTGLTDLLTAKVNFYTTYVSILDNLSQYHYYEGTLYESVAPP